LEYIELAGIEERQNNEHPRMTRISRILLGQRRQRKTCDIGLYLGSGGRERPGRSAAAVQSA
jgi:hypothetical protein